MNRRSPLRSSGRMLLIVLASCVTDARAQLTERGPHIGYLYPAGGRQGSTFQIVAGGQSLRGVTDVYITGEGVTASLIQHMKPLRMLDKEQRQELQRRLKEVRDRRLEEAAGQDRGVVPMGKRPIKEDATRPEATTKSAVHLPDHPLLYNLDNLSLRELQHVVHELLDLKKNQPNAQIAESVLIEVAIDPRAAPGERALRLMTPAGLTNPMCFEVGSFPEARELEPNDPQASTPLPPDPPAELPILLNGQVKPGDTDRFRFQARRGQRLVMDAHARRLVPYLADAVPGWFQATLTLYDANGREVAFSDDYRFDPDPVLFYDVPEDGEYEVEIRDALYRGREDFVYRIAVGEQPFITQSFPLGGRTGAKTVATIDGWNLPAERLLLATPPGTAGVHETALRQKERLSNSVTYAVDMLPECTETEPNDAASQAQPIEIPRIVNGRIERPGDVDVFQVQGRAGDELVAEVHARRLRSPLDSLLRVIDSSGHVLAWNDDCEEKETGLLTHHADSYVRALLPEDGVYQVQLQDSQHQGGEAYGYRLRLSRPRPDFALRLTPSSLNIPTGRTVPVCVYVLREDGFDGEVVLSLKEAPAGFALGGGRVPKGHDRVWITLTAPRERFEQPVVLQIEGSARIVGRAVRRPVVPAEDMMQAFIYRHLTPSRELMVAVTGGRATAPPVQLSEKALVRIPSGGTAEVRVVAARRPFSPDIRLELRDPPKGVTLQNVASLADGLKLILKAEGDAAPVGFSDNLIIDIVTETSTRPAGGGSGGQKRRISLGVLPAIPFEIVQR